MGKRKAVSADATTKHHADVALAKRFDDLLAQAQEAEQALREAQADNAPEQELHDAGKRLDSALTDVMRAAFAAQRAEIGARGYDDRIYRRKAMATPKVRAWTMEAERLLTLRESHRLTGIVRLARPPAPEHSDSLGGHTAPPPATAGSPGSQGAAPRTASLT
jgi:D-alanyl-D-alanine dipeptidase